MNWCKRIGLVGVAGALATVGTVGMALPAGAAERTPVQQAVFVVKDQGGGAYWLTTSTALAAGQTSVDAGETLLLTVNDRVILPIQEQLP